MALSPSGRILVKVTGARGGQGKASGPLASGSVDSDKITNSPTEKTAILAKIGGASSSDVNQLRAAIGNAAFRDAQPGSTEKGKMIDFTLGNYRIGERPSEITVVGSVTASINNDSRLEVDAPYSDTSKRVRVPMKFAEGVFRARLLKGAFMIRFTDKMFNGRALWSSNGTTIEYGYISGGGSVTSVANGPFNGVNGDVMWVEVVTGPTANGQAFLVRSWTDGTARPSNPTFSAAFGPGINGLEHNEGDITFASFSGSTAKYEAVQVFDNVARAQGQAEFVGRWFTRFEGGRIIMCTTRGGSRMRCAVTNTATLGIRYVGTGGVVSGYTPVVDAYVNGAYRATMSFPPTFGAIGGVALSGLDPAIVSYVDFRVRGVNEANDKWLLGAGLCIDSLDPGSGSVGAWKDDRPAFVFYGDSITEGIVARGTPSTPMNSGGDLSWPILLSDALNLKAIVNGFGGTDLGVSGSGGMAPTEQNSFAYMKTREIDIVKENARYIAICLGPNANGAGVSANTYQQRYTAYLQLLLKKHPNVVRIFAIRTFSGAYATQVQAAVNSINDPRITYVDTSSWSNVTTTDGLHPDLAGHQAIANRMITAVGNLQPTLV